MLGEAEQVLVDQARTRRSIDGAGEKAGDRGARGDQIRAQIEATTSDYDREKLQERLARAGRRRRRPARRRHDGGRGAGAQGPRR
jgi:chaperonin GroEL